MAKTKTAYFCRACGAESPKWLGRCPACGEWNTMVEEPVTKNTGRPSRTDGTTAVPRHLDEVEELQGTRIDLHNAELNRVLGGGMVKGSLILLGGEPGIGKSTLALQVALKMEGKTLYVSGEESLQQIKMRAARIGRLQSPCWFLNETSLEDILQQCNALQPEFVIIDSIQTLNSAHIDSSAGSVSQIRECAAGLLQYAKQTGTSVILIGHITKDGILAGPKILEHIVDVVLQFEGDNRQIYRVLRALKNRFGSTSELGVFEMIDTGLREVPNPSEILIQTHSDNLSGVAVGAGMDGIRPFLIEVQALVSSAVYGTPQRSCTGFDGRRLNMLLAVLEKRIGFKLASQDVFLNMVGGMKIDDPSIDLAVLAAILSSSLDLSIPYTWCFAGEIGLSGEIRPVSRIGQRIREAEKAGFTKIFVASSGHENLPADTSIQVVRLRRVEELVKGLKGML